MTFALPDDLRAAIHRGDPLLSIARTHGVPIDRLIPYARALRSRPALRTPEGRAAFLQSPRPKQLEMTLAYALERMQSPGGPADLRALERLLLQTQHHIDRWHDPIARQQREHKESRREAIRKETYIDDVELFEYQVERRAIGYLLKANEHLRAEIIRCLEEARISLAAA